MSRMRQPPLFDLPAPTEPRKKVKQQPHPVWSENKARLIDRYLYYFVQITKHGTYIDGFAGPQAPTKTEMWSARMVIESRPRWLRNFYLFDESPQQVDRLKAMVEAQPAPEKGKREPKRHFRIECGDFNRLVDVALDDGRIKEKEATFCLLDQRTFECHWRTVQRLAEFKKQGNKIELFYFLPNGWLERALSAIKNESIVEAWWGRSDWRNLRHMNKWDRATKFADRFLEELGYRSAMAWPIFAKEEGEGVMYYMIHATDHLDAPGLMQRAYARANRPKGVVPQMDLSADISKPHLRPPRRPL